MIIGDMKAQPFIGVLCDASFSVVAARIKAAGYRIARVSPDMLSSGSRPGVDAWVVDCEQPNSVAEALASIDTPIVAISNRPNPENRGAFRAWTERVIRSLDRLTADAWHGRTGAASSHPAAYTGVEGVWLLVGSSGADSAAREFLEALPWVPPVAFLFAQHVEAGDELALTNRLNKVNRHLHCELALGRHWFNPRQLLVVPARCGLEFGPHGEVFSLRESWEGRFDPYIDQLMMKLAGITPALSGVITLSGDSTDGLQGARALRDSGVRIWAQAPKTAKAPAMPKWIDKLRIASKVGSPTELALEFLDFYSNTQSALNAQADAANDPRLESSSA